MTNSRGNGGVSASAKATERKWLNAFSYVTGAVAVVVCVAGVIVAAIVGQLALALLLVGLTLFWSIPYGQKLFIKRIVPRAKVDSAGTTLRPGRSVDVLGAAMMTIGSVTGGAWAALGFLGEVSFPFGADYAIGYVIFFGGLGSFCTAYLVVMIRNHGTAYVRLTPDGFVLAEGYFTGRGSWTEVVTVNDDTPVYEVGFSVFKRKKAQPYARCAITITKADGTTAAVPNGNLYASNGDALRELIRFYWQHPEHRGELTDDRALARLRAWEPTAP
jgi:hypothetical protein